MYIFFNTVLLISRVIAAVFPLLYMMSEVDHLSVFLSQFAQIMPGWPPYRYFLL